MFRLRQYIPYNQEKIGGNDECCSRRQKFSEERNGLFHPDRSASFFARLVFAHPRSIPEYRNVGDDYRCRTLSGT